jgi:glyoxylase I family protein
MTDPKNIVRSHDLVWRHLAGVELDAQDRLRTTDEQEKNALRRIDHIGLGCRDAETTRHFYEDILGMPLVLAMVMPDPYRDDRQEHCHFFFEVGSGTCLSFFDHPRAFTEDDFRPCTGMLRHIAIEVAEDQLVQDFRERLEQAGVTARYIDHDVQHSLYFTDPKMVTTSRLLSGRHRMPSSWGNRARLLVRYSRAGPRIAQVTPRCGRVTRK